MNIYYLYIKTHKKTGLKYLGQTKQDPYKYSGSGIYWLSHLNKHGYEHDTEILQRCYTKSSLAAWGLYYSILWSIVKSKKWANLKPESGDGGMTRETALKRNQNQAYLTKKNASLAAAAKNPIVLENRRRGRFEPEVLERHRHQTSAALLRPDRRAKRAKQIGKNAPRYDATIYTFVHKNGQNEICPRQELEIKYSLNHSGLSELISGKRKSHKGWSILQNDDFINDKY